MEDNFLLRLPLRMEGDYNDEGTDNEHGWPTAVLDHGQAGLRTMKSTRDVLQSVGYCYRAVVVFVAPANSQNTVTVGASCGTRSWVSIPRLL